jgi:hypothetical protein
MAKTMQELVGMESPFEASLKAVGYKAPETKEQEKYIEEKSQADIDVAKGKTKIAEEGLKTREELYARPDLQKQKIDAFAPTPESGSDLAKLFALTTAITFFGGGKGRYSGQAAMGNLASAMEGYKKGRKDLFAQEMKEYDKNMKSAMENNKLIEDKLKEYLDLAGRKDEAAVVKLAEVQALTNRQGGLAQIEKMSGENLAKHAETLGKARADWVKQVMDIQSKAADREASAISEYIDPATGQVVLINKRTGQVRPLEGTKGFTKAGAAAAKGGQSSVLLQGRAENIREAFVQAATDIVNITKFPPNTMLGVFSGLTGASADGMTSGIRNAIARGVTEKEQRMLESLLSGIEGHMAFALGGGYATSQSKARMDQYKAQIARAGDDPAQVPLMLARFRQEMNILSDNFPTKPGATPEMNVAVQKANDLINQAVPFTVDDVLSAELGERKSSSPTPKPKGSGTKEDPIKLD